MKFIGQKTEGILYGDADEDRLHSKENGLFRIITEYERRAVKISSVIEYRAGDRFIKTYSIFESSSDEKQTLEMASSFNVCAFPCVGKGMRQKDLVLHRMKSKWSMEGKLESRTFLDMELEPAWLRIGASSERFGEVGSMPVRRYFPWMIVTDLGETTYRNTDRLDESSFSGSDATLKEQNEVAFNGENIRKNGYSIGAQLYINSSWQMEVYNKDEKNSLSGGIADREFGHWMKDLLPGEKFITPEAVLTVVKNAEINVKDADQAIDMDSCSTGSFSFDTASKYASYTSAGSETMVGTIDEVSFRLTSAQNINLENAPESEKELPIIFNEYCTSWGNPDEKEMEAIAERLKGHGIKYCVIDAGWHVKDGNDWSDIGDWITNKTKFPSGLKKTADKIRECGMIPGLWYEMEVVGKDSEMFKQEDMLLKRDGIPIQTMFRRFLDMRKPEVIEYLTERVINNLKDNGFGYLKVDYNDNLGIGCDGAESLGEAMRQSLVESRNFFKKIREEIPDIVIENCSSGGHRLEPSMQAVTSMASFSDAHEWQAIPVIAANVTRAILPAQSQIWAVLRAKDDEKRLYYSLSNTFLGRMCLSGDMSTISEEQWKIVDKAIAFYRKCADIIKDGRNYRYGSYQDSYNELKGWQSVVRNAGDGNSALAVISTFAMSGKTELELELPKKFTSFECFSRTGIDIELNGQKIVVAGVSDFDGLVLRLS